MDEEYMDEEYYRRIHDALHAELNAREEGHRAYLDGLSRDDNPYNNEDWDLHLAWKEGFEKI